MRRNTKVVGDRSEVRVLSAFVESGYNVSIPFGENHRYDFIAEDEDGRLLKIQVKTGRLRDGAVRFNGFSSHSHRGGATTRRYHGEVDFFAVYCPDTDEVYVIPEADACIRPYLRIEAPKNNMKKLIRWASDYAFGASRPGDSGLELPL
jgi:hypothetical protein